MIDWMAPYRGRLQHSVEFRERLRPDAPWWARLVIWLTGRRPPPTIIVRRVEKDDG